MPTFIDHNNKFPKYSYLRPVEVQPHVEITHLLVNPPNEYPRINLKPSQCDRPTVRLVDYDVVKYEDGTVEIWLVPNSFTIEQKPSLVACAKFSRQFLPEAEEFLLRGLLNSTSKH